MPESVHNRAYNQYQCKYITYRCKKITYRQIFWNKFFLKFSFHVFYFDKKRLILAKKSNFSFDLMVLHRHWRQNHDLTVFNGTLQNVFEVLTPKKNKFGIAPQRQEKYHFSFCFKQDLQNPETFCERQECLKNSISATFRL